MSADLPFVRVAGEQTVLSPEQREGLPHISLAVNANSTERYLMGLNMVNTTILEQLSSLKLPPNALIPDRQKPGKTQSVTAEAMVAHLSRKRQLPDVWIDTKFSFDGSELAASVDYLISRSLVQKEHSHKRHREGSLDKNHLNRINQLLPPRYITIVIFNQSDPEELRLAKTHASNYFEVVGMVSSSKQKTGTNEEYGIDHKGITAGLARMAMDAGIHTLSAAASDAELIRDALSGHRDVGNLRIFGSGATLHPADIGEHDTNVSVDDVKGAVDVFVLGQAVLFHSNPDVHLLEYAQAIGQQ